MDDPRYRETEIHVLYLSTNVWGELKKRAVMEGSNASKITDYVLRTFLKYMPAVNLPQRRTRVKIQEKLNRRNLHLRKDTWERIAKVTGEKKISISVLSEFLLRSYLGLDITDDLKPRRALKKMVKTRKPSHRSFTGEAVVTERINTNQIPEGLRPYFQEYDPARLDLERDADLIIQRALESGTWEEARWLFETYGRQHIRVFLRVRGERLLSRVTFNYWRRLLGIKKWQQSPFPTAKGELWDR